MQIRTFASALAACVPLSAPAVYLNADGIGQALIFPYYTMQSANGNPFNTYLSVVNHTADAKAIRVRVRESRNSREVASFNLYLSPNDIWTGVILAEGAQSVPRLISFDRSCTSPALSQGANLAPGVTFQNALYTGTFADGNGDGLDRTREGWVEMIEMATLTGVSAAAVTHNASGIPANCAALEGPLTPEVAAPTGGLSGTLTLINVNSGMDFTVNADALAELATRPFHRPAGDPYPDFNANEIDAVSVVTANGFVYRSSWNRPVDAVSAALMRAEVFAEYILDAGTHSGTDVVLTFPTRQHYLAGSVLAAPFGMTAGSRTGWAADCNWPGTNLLGTPMNFSYRSREETGVRGTFPSTTDFGLPPGVPFTLCAASAVLEVTNGARSTAPTAVLGSVARGIHSFEVPTIQNGWLSLFPYGDFATLQSLAASTRFNLATGAVTPGAHVFQGLPVTGFHLRTFVNGTLICSSGTCQGNYGGSFPLKYRRVISPST